MIEAWWRSLKHQWLFLHSLDSVATVRRLVAFYVDEHNHVLPHSAFRGQTPDEMYFGTGDGVPADLRHARRRAPSTRGGQSVGVLRDVPVTQRGRLDAWPLTAVADHGARTRAPRATAGEPEPARSTKEGQNRLRDQTRYSSIAACRLEWRELARTSPECREDSSAGIPEAASCTMQNDGGTRLVSVVRARYNIVSAGDLREAAKRLDAATGTISGTIEQDRRCGSKI